MHKHQGRPLTAIASGGKAKVVALLGGRGFQNRMVSMGLKVGCEIEVLHRGSRGPVLVAAGGTRLALGHGMAERILVQVPSNS